MVRQMFNEKFMRFPQGKCKAMTFSYDDGVRADLRLLEIFARCGLKGTFNLNSELFECADWHGRLNEEQTLSAFVGCGQEIALHGARHLFLAKIPLPEAVKEIADNRAWLEEKFGAIVRGMAYAYNDFNGDIKKVLEHLGVAYARTTLPSHTFELPADWLELKPTCHHGDPELLGLADRFFTRTPAEEFKHREPWLFYIWGHSYEFDDNDNWEIIENLGRRAKSVGDVWHATNIEIFNYVQAFKRLEFSLDGERVHNPSAIPVWLDIRGKTYEVKSGATVVFERG